jgi:hypothetical protein
MRGTGIDSDVEIYATKQSKDGRTMDKVRNPSNSFFF